MLQATIWTPLFMKLDKAPAMAVAGTAQVTQTQSVTTGIPVAVSVSVGQTPCERWGIRRWPTYFFTYSRGSLPTPSLYRDRWRWQAVELPVLPT